MFGPIRLLALALGIECIILEIWRVGLDTTLLSTFLFPFLVYTIPETGIERVQALADISRSALCCHSNETRAPIANPPNSAQLEGTPTIPPTYSHRVRQRRRPLRKATHYVWLLTSSKRLNELARYDFGPLQRRFVTNTSANFNPPSSNL